MKDFSLYFPMQKMDSPIVASPIPRLLWSKQTWIYTSWGYFLLKERFIFTNVYPLCLDLEIRPLVFGRSQKCESFTADGERDRWTIIGQMYRNIRRIRNSWVFWSDHYERPWSNPIKPVIFQRFDHSTTATITS